MTKRVAGEGSGGTREAAEDAGLTRKLMAPPASKSCQPPFLSLESLALRLARKTRRALPKRNGDRESDGPGAGFVGRLTSARRQESPFSRRASPEALCVTPVPSSLPRQKGPPHLFFFELKTSPTKSAGEVGFVARELDIQIGVRERAASTTREVRRLWRGVVAPQRNSRGVVHGSGTARCCSARRAWARCA